MMIAANVEGGVIFFGLCALGIALCARSVVRKRNGTWPPRPYQKRLFVVKANASDISKRTARRVQALQNSGWVIDSVTVQNTGGWAIDSAQILAHHAAVDAGPNWKPWQQRVRQWHQERMERKRGEQ